MVAGVFTAGGGEDGEDGDADRQSIPCPPPDGSAARRVRFPTPPPMCIDRARSYTATVETDLGPFSVALDDEAAPQTVNNFVFLARYHAYDDVPFHRAVPGFVVQGGDVEQGNGKGGPGYSIPDELPPPGRYQLGSVAMANTGAPHSGGSQFFVVTGPEGLSLPPRFSLFGQVVDGMAVVQRINDDGSPDPEPPRVLHRIVRVVINESG